MTMEAIKAAELSSIGRDLAYPHLLASVGTLIRRDNVTEKSELAGA